VSRLLACLVAGVLATSAQAGLLDKYKQPPAPAPVVAPAPVAAPAPTPAPVVAPTPEVKPEPKVEAKADPKPAVKAEPKPAVKAEAKPATAKPVKTAKKVDPKKVEPKHEVKPEVKVVTKPEVKHEPAKVAKAKSIDDLYAEQTKAECDKLAISLFCREKIRLALCDGKWSPTPPAGQTACVGQSAN
jgi:hypothetical protein